MSSDPGRVARGYNLDNWPLIACVYRIGADRLFVQHGDICVPGEPTESTDLLGYNIPITDAVIVSKNDMGNLIKAENNKANLLKVFNNHIENTS